MSYSLHSTFIHSLRAGSRLDFKCEMRDASGEAAPAHLPPRSRGFAARLASRSRIKPKREPARRLF